MDIEPARQLGPLNRALVRLGLREEPRTRVTLRYRQVVDVTPWRVIFRDDDPTDPDPKPSLKAEWRSEWAEFVAKCRCISDAPLGDEEAIAMLEGRPASVTVTAGAPAQPEGEGGYLADAVSYTSLPLEGDEEDLYEEDRAT